MAYVNARTIQVIRRKERRALRLDDGVIRCQRKTAILLEDGETVMCALFLKFVPKKAKPHAEVPSSIQPAAGRD